MTESPHIVPLDEQNIMDVVVHGSTRQPVLVDFWADWCAPCKALMPILEKLAVEYDGRFVLAKLDTEAHPGIAQQLGIRSLPTVMLFKDGQPVDQFMGALPEGEVRRFLETHLGPPPADEEEGEDARVARAMALFEAGRAADAEALLREGQAEDPENAEILVALGQVALARGDLETAESCLGALPEAARESAAGRRLAATLALARDHREGDSVESLRAQLEASPTDSEKRYRLAIAEALAGDVPAAMDHLLHLVRTDPAHADGAPRARLLSLFDLLGDDPLVGQYRRKLFALLH